MKITKPVVARFEMDRRAFGTKVALSNLLWELASDLLKDIGVVSLKTTYQPKSQGTMVSRLGKHPTRWARS